MAGPGAPGERQTSRNALIIGHNHVGDEAYRSCSLDELAAGLPKCRWSYLTSSDAADILEGNPAIAEVLPWSAGEDAWQLEPGKFAELKQRQFDVVLCTNTLRHYP